MTERERIERAPLGEWVAESLRATAFPSGEAELKPDGWWRSVLGEEPESQMSKRTGERREEGTFRGAILILNVSVGRIDWILRPKLSKDEPSGGFPAIGGFAETCAHFRELMHRWFPLSPPLERLAFGAVVVLPVANKAEGYTRLARYLPAVQLDAAEDSSDFLYRINRPRPSRSKIPNLRINRLSAWSVVEIHTQQVELSSPLQRPKFIQGEPAFTCRVELDVNTAPKFDGQFSNKVCTELFDELLDLAGEILQAGDRP